MSGWPVHRAALRNLNGLRKQLALMGWDSASLAVVCGPLLDEVELQVRADRERKRVGA